MKQRTKKYYAASKLTYWIFCLFVFHTLIHLFGITFFILAPKTVFFAARKLPPFNLNTIASLLVISGLIFLLVLSRLKFLWEFKSKQIAALFIILVLCSIGNFGYLLNLRRIGLYVKDGAERYLASAKDELQEKQYRNQFEKEELENFIESYQEMLRE